MVDIDRDLVGHLPQDMRLFVIARSLDGEPVAVQPVTGLAFPVNFCITSANLLDASAQLPDQLRLSALLTTSDDPFGSGITGATSEPVSLGSEGIYIRLFCVEDAPFGTGSAVASVKTSSASRLLGIDRDSTATLIQGTVTLGVPLDDRAKPTDVLYIIARSLDGHLLAVSKPYRGPQFPVEYRLGRNTVLMGMLLDDQDMVLIARLDRDGNALSSPGDIEGESTRKPVRIGDTGVDIVLDTLVR